MREAPSPGGRLAHYRVAAVLRRRQGGAAQLSV
jgi:hypothetical protein